MDAMATRRSAARDAAKPGAEYVITRYRGSNSNLRAQMMKIIRRAGLQPWPKLFHNLRATRQTVLEEEFPSHVVCAWIGNSQAIARKNYLQVTDDQFSRATGDESESSDPAACSATPSETHLAPCHNEIRGNSESRLDNETLFFSEDMAYCHTIFPTQWATLDSNQ